MDNNTIGFIVFSITVLSAFIGYLVFLCYISKEPSKTKGEDEGKKEEGQMEENLS